MATPWYLPGILFLLFVIVCVIFLVFIYWKASRFLKDGIMGRITKENSVIELNEIMIKKKNLVPFTSITGKYGSEAQSIANANIDVSLRYMNNKKYISGIIENIQSLKDVVKEGNNFIRFHVTLLASKHYKFKTTYRNINEIAIGVTFGLSDVTLSDLRSSVLRLRLYARHIQHGMIMGTEKCLGEIHMSLSKYAESLESGKEVRTNYTILPKGEQFPKLVSS